MIRDDYDYIVDAVDTVTAKIDLVVQAQKRNIPIISCMGAGNKLGPTKFQVADIYKTTMDPLAKVMRRELRQWGLNPLRLCTPRRAYKTKESEENSCSSNCICPKGTQRKCSDKKSGSRQCFICSLCCGADNCW